MDFTVATPTYNRANVLYRVYESLCAQTYKNFEWIVVDDGSEDSTLEIVEKWKNEADFPISYYYQENSGKHIALNLAVRNARGDLFVIADSDDSFKPESLEVLLDFWKDIPVEKRPEFRGVTCRCFDPVTNEAIGMEFPNGIHDLLGIEASFKYHYNFEMWGFNRTEVMKEFPFPDTKGQGLAYYPEAVIWNQMGMKYKVRFVNAPLRGFYRDQDNATTVRKRNRAKENIHLWAHYINELLPYFRHNPIRFIKAFVGLSMDGLRLSMTPRDILKIPKSRIGKIMVTLFFPVGYVLYLKRK